MNYKVHFSFGIFISLLFSNFTKYNYASLDNLIIHFLILFFSLLPDLDINTSKIGKNIGILSKIINIIFGHRGFFHSFWIIIIIYLFLLPLGYEIAVLGYLGHLILDMFTKQGIRLFYPFIKINGNLDSNIIVNFIIFIILLLLNIFLIFNLAYNFV
jgi:inner membrane protein